MLDDIGSELSHISDMLDHPRPSITILRFACMVLIALYACSLSEAVSPLASTILRFACMVLIALRAYSLSEAVSPSDHSAF